LRLKYLQPLRGTHEDALKYLVCLRALCVVLLGYGLLTVVVVVVELTAPSVVPVVTRLEVVEVLVDGALATLPGCTLAGGATTTTLALGASAGTWRSMMVLLAGGGAAPETTVVVVASGRLRAIIAMAPPTTTKAMTAATTAVDEDERA
jgi:hypothetical protein